jgi:hypothetical protein
MMRGIRRLAVGLAVASLLTGGALSASMDVAHADTTADSCFGASDTSPAFQCTLSATISSASAITVTVSDDAAGTNENVTVAVTTLSCSDDTATTNEPASSTTGTTPLTDAVLPLPSAAADGQCSVAATVSVPKTVTSASEFSAQLTYTPVASATPTASAAPWNPVKGYGGKCMDDKGNSSANRAEVIIWGCNSSDPAETWKYSSSELIHNGKCLNDKANGGSGSKLILWSCNGGANEKWTELANGELKLQSHGGTLCVDDPAYSTKNGTQLIVYTCKDSANQKWSLP